VRRASSWASIAQSFELGDHPNTDETGRFVPGIVALEAGSMCFSPHERRRRVVLILALLAMASCADQPPAPPPQASAPTRPAFKIQSFPPEPPAPPSPGTAAELPPGSLRTNDPSAPPDTPLCGTAAREANAAGAAISPAIVASGGACLANACFDPSTDTYIGADGFRHVCQ
jgi:hypothetical protein